MGILGARNMILFVILDCGIRSRPDDVQAVRRGGRGAGAAGRVPASSSDVLASISVECASAGVRRLWWHATPRHFALVGSLSSDVKHDVILLGLMLATMVWVWLMLWTIVKPQRKLFGDTDGFRR